MWQQPLSICSIEQPFDSMSGELEMQRAYYMFVV
jgi:hypothetical protein